MSEAGPSKQRRQKQKHPKDRVRSSKVKKVSEGKDIEALEQAALQYVSTFPLYDHLMAHR